MQTALCWVVPRPGRGGNRNSCPGLAATSRLQTYVGQSIRCGDVHDVEQIIRCGVQRYVGQIIRCGVQRYVGQIIRCGALHDL